MVYRSLALVALTVLSLALTSSASAASSAVRRCESYLTTLLVDQSWQEEFRKQIQIDLDPKNEKGFTVFDLPPMPEGLADELYHSLKAPKMPILIPFIGDQVHFGIDSRGDVGDFSYSDPERLAFRFIMDGLVTHFEETVATMPWRNEKFHYPRTQIRIMDSSEQYYGSPDERTAMSHRDGGTYTLLLAVHGPGPLYSRQVGYDELPAATFAKMPGVQQLKTGSLILFRNRSWRDVVNTKIYGSVADEGLSHSPPNQNLPRILLTMQWGFNG